MPRALSKVTKQISKKRGSKLNALHENSRDSKRLRSAGMREDKIARILSAARNANQIYVDRVNWFQDAIPESEEDEKTITDGELQALVSEYIHRTDDALQELKSQRRPGRPPSSAEDQLKHQQEGEEKEFKAGFWVPDVRQADGRNKLRKWNGEWAGLNTLKFVRVMKDGAIRDSSFPPKGLS